MYRLNSDLNPLHIDPDMAALGGFDRPILHGLCTYGITARILTEKLLGDKVEIFGEITGRFTSHVFPGETLEVWGKEVSIDIWEY